MKKSHQILFITFVGILMITPSIFAQQPTEKTYAFRLASGNFVTFVANGGLDISGKEITPKQIFAVIDINGGAIEEGDKLKIRYEASVWREDKDNKKVHRVAIKGSNESETIFKLKKKEAFLILQTPSGKYLTFDGTSLSTTDKQDNAIAFALIPAAPPLPFKAYSVGFKLASGKYLSTVGGGGLSANASDVAPGQTFTVIDVNGETLNEGDVIKIVWQGSYWHEDKENNKLNRVPVRGANEAECTFKMRVKGKSVFLETASGKFVMASADGSGLVTIDKREEASLLEVVPAQAPPPPAKP